MKKSLKSVLLAGAMLGAGMAGMATTGANVGTPGNDKSQTSKEAINKEAEPVKSVSQKKKQKAWTGEYTRHKGNAGEFKNQRQYRKMVAQNPHLRKSKKHRSKN